jgi:magnesium-transporting ATPase (P-type)
VAGHVIEPSISDYYYTGMRNLLVGSLCAISMFLLCCRGYDRKDEIAGIFSAVCALGVAFFPTAPDCGATPRQQQVGFAHYIFAMLLFSTLVYFCLVLFKMTAKDRKMTRKKRQRNRVYTVCGYVIAASILAIAVPKLLQALHVSQVADCHATSHRIFLVESIALMAFGVAWLIKGETFLKDEEPARIGTADRV